MFNNVKWFGKVFKSNTSMTVGINLFSEIYIFYDLSTKYSLNFPFK